MISDNAALEYIYCMYIMSEIIYADIVIFLFIASGVLIGQSNLVSIMLK